MQPEASSWSETFLWYRHAHRLGGETYSPQISKALPVEKELRNTPGVRKMGGVALKQGVSIASWGGVLSSPGSVGR